MKKGIAGGFIASVIAVITLGVPSIASASQPFSNFGNCMSNGTLVGQEHSLIAPGGNGGNWPSNIQFDDGSVDINGNPNAEGLVSCRKIPASVGN